MAPAPGAQQNPQVRRLPPFRSPACPSGPALCPGDGLLHSCLKPRTARWLATPAPAGGYTDEAQCAFYCPDAGQYRLGSSCPGLGCRSGCALLAAVFFLHLCFLLGVSF